MQHKHLTEINFLTRNIQVCFDINLHSSKSGILKKSASRYISYLILFQTTKTQKNPLKIININKIKKPGFVFS